LAADFVAGIAFSSATSGVATSAFDLPRDFLTARLRGDFGSIAMAPNPLAHIYKRDMHSRGPLRNFLERNLRDEQILCVVRRRRDKDRWPR
jgi:hypothetical protein